MSFKIIKNWFDKISHTIGEQLLRQVVQRWVAMILSLPITLYVTNLTDSIKPYCPLAYWFIFLLSIIFIFFIMRLFNGDFSVKNKLLMIPEPLLEFPNNKIHTLRIAVPVYNCSHRIISCLLDQEKTRIIVNGNTHQQEALYDRTSSLFPPYHLSKASTGIIELNGIDDTKNTPVHITATISLKYGTINDEKHEVWHKVNISCVLSRLENGSIVIQPITAPPVSVQG